MKIGVTANGNQEYLQHAQFVPGGGLVFVKDNDIFYKSLVKSLEVERVTKTGVPGTIYNGVADWLYEEEILGQSPAVWSDREGGRIAYLVFNDSLVDLVTLENFGSERKFEEKTNELGKKKLRYPKVRSLLTQNYGSSKIRERKTCQTSCVGEENKLSWKGGNPSISIML